MRYLKMLIQVVGIPIFELTTGALALRGGFGLLHSSWNTDCRTLRHTAAKAVPKSRQHVSRDRFLFPRFFFLVSRVKTISRAADSRRRAIRGGCSGHSCHAARHHCENDDCRGGCTTPLHVSISHRLFPLNNKSHDCPQRNETRHRREKKRKKRRWSRAIKGAQGCATRSDHRRRSTAEYGRGWLLAAYLRVPLIVATIDSRRNEGPVRF